MKKAYDFRYVARASLAGKWFVAVAAGVVASLLGAASSLRVNLNVNYEEAISAFDLSLVRHSVITAMADAHGILFGIGVFAVILFAIASVILVALSVVYAVLSGIVKVGYSAFNLNIIDGVPHGLSDLFSHFSNWKTIFVSNLLTALYTFLWSLLFIIPGIVASYSYAMTDYILAENPSMTASEAIKKSKELMYGNKFRYFCLELSFIGWNILVSFTFGIGNLWLTPYKQAAYAAFYREISCREEYIAADFAQYTEI